MSSDIRYTFSAEYLDNRRHSFYVDRRELKVPRLNRTRSERRVTEIFMKFGRPFVLIFV